jgi:hypothetical protein
VLTSLSLSSGLFSWPRRKAKRFFDRLASRDRSSPCTASALDMPVSPAAAFAASYPRKRKTQTVFRLLSQNAPIRAPQSPIHLLRFGKPHLFARRQRRFDRREIFFPTRSNISERGSSAV